MSRANLPPVVCDVDRIERALAELWRDDAGHGEPVTRACGLNLVVACADEAGDLEAAERLVAEIVETEPGRALLIAPAAGRGTVEAYVSAVCHRGAHGGIVCSEQIVLEAGPRSLELVPATVLQLVVGQLPVYTWWRRPLVANDPLLAALGTLSQRLIVDGAREADPRGVLTALASLRRATMGTAMCPADLTWSRLEPWRDAVASFFDRPPGLQQVAKVVALEITTLGGDAKTQRLTLAGAYLAGWLASRLGLTPAGEPGRWQRPDGQAVQITFRREAGGGAATLHAVRVVTRDGSAQPVAFVVERTDAECERVRLVVESQGAGAPARTIQLPDRGEAALLCGLLQEPLRDPVYKAALTAAALLACPAHAS